MEVCPETVVLQSAFQLVEKKAGSLLASVGKGECTEYVHILATAVEEITQGLQCDLDPQQALTWSHKIHSLLFYALVRKQYQTKEAEKERRGYIASYSGMDLLSEMVPTFSIHLYVQLVKHFHWTRLFIQSLSCVTQTVGDRLLDDLLSHCRQEPMTQSDNEVIAMVTQMFLSRCLLVPDNTPALVTNLLTPLILPRQYIQTVYPEECVSIATQSNDNVTMATEGQSVTLATVTELKDDKATDLCSDIDSNQPLTRAGRTFFDNHVEKNSVFLNQVVEHLESRVGDSVCFSKQQDDCLAAIGLLKYLYVCGQGDEQFRSWLIHNLFAEEEAVLTKNGNNHTSTLTFMVNTRIANQISKHLQLDLIDRVCSLLQTGDDSEQSASERNCNNIELLQGLFMKRGVFFRMLGRSSSEGNMDDGDSNEGECDVVKGENWTGDITLDALMWRIDNKLPPLKACVEVLLEPRCEMFWTSERLLETVCVQPDLFQKQSLFLRLLDMVHAIHDRAPAALVGGHTQEAGDRQHSAICERQSALLRAAFSCMSAGARDRVIVDVHCSRQVDMGWLSKGESQAANITNLLNKVTTDTGPQVVVDVMWACLKSPVTVLSAIIHTSVSHKQQAANLAQMLGALEQTCRSRHPAFPMSSLLVALLREFLHGRTLDEKQQATICVFIQTLVQDVDKRVLSATEFLVSCVLPHLDVDSLASAIPGSIQFALTLLAICLPAIQKEASDWSSLEFEPIAVLVTLAEILHECTVIWNIDDVIDIDDITEQVLVDMATSRLGVKGQTAQCMNGLVDMLQQSDMMDDCCVDWLYTVTGDLHWSVQCRLASLLPSDTLDMSGGGESCLHAPCPAVRMVYHVYGAALDCAHLPTESTCLSTEGLQYEEMVQALVQIVPHVTSEEFTRILEYMARLQERESTCDWLYRVTSPLLPLKHLTTDLQQVLYTSQLLCDLMVSLVSVLSRGPWSLAVQHHALQLYCPHVQRLCEQICGCTSVTAFCLSEIFQHVCHVTRVCDLVDPTMVVLLHIVTKMADLDLSCHDNSSAKVNEIGSGDREFPTGTGQTYVKRLVVNMLSNVMMLPDRCEEKHMMIKKISLCLI